ncbi:MAG: hypothetical protein M3Y80_09010, partial [Verrucomicrobiota bacterium]|nr:hypothetical protein [Verrucomicrobiota bacterium]
LRHIFDLHVISDDVALQPRGELFADFRIAVDEQRVDIGADEDVRVDLAFDRQDAGVNSRSVIRLAEIVADLPVQIADAIGAAEAQFGALREINDPAGLQRSRTQ